MTIRFHWGTGIAVGYTIFALGTAAFVAFAMTQTVELVADDYYAQALQHDHRMDARQRTDALGPAFAIAVDNPGHRVTVQWPREMARGVIGTATFYRPSDAAADQTLALAPDVEGLQVFDTSDLVRGRWRFALEWEAAGRSWRTERDLYLP
jgi:nitrogen fixation protein FixH